MVKARRGDFRRLGVGEGDPGAFGVLFRPAAPGARAGDAEVRGAGGGGEPPAGGVDAGEEPEPRAAVVLAGLLLGVRLDAVRDAQAPGQGREEGLVEGGDEVVQGLLAEGLGVGALVAVFAGGIGRQLVRGVCRGR